MSFAAGVEGGLLAINSLEDDTLHAVMSLPEDDQACITLGGHVWGEDTTSGAEAKVLP